MQIEEGPDAQPRTARSASETGQILGSAATALTVLVAAAASSALIVSYQVALGSPVPIGVDTPSHLWRSRVVHALGLPGLFGSSPFEYQANTANPDRIGLPVLGSVLDAVVGVGPWRLMFVAAAVGAAVLAFAAWALSRAIDEPRWAGPIYAIVVATSLPFAITARSHLDNALVDGMVVAAGAIAIRLARAEGGLWAGVVLAAGAVLMHWPVGFFLIGVLGLYALGLIPESIEVHREGTTWMRTPAGRVGLVAGLSGGAGLAAIVATPGAHVFGTDDRAPFLDNVRRILPWYRILFALPVAGLGAGLLWVQRPHPPRRRALLFYLAWLLPIAVGVVAFVAGVALPVMRLAAIALPIPLLAAAAAVGVIRLAASPRGLAGILLAIVASVTLAIGISAQMTLARESFEDTRPMVQENERELTRTAIAYLTQTAPDRKAVFVVQRDDDRLIDFGVGRAFRRIRALAPGALAPNIATYLGNPDRLLAGEPTRRPEVERFDEVSDTYWALLEPWLTNDTTVLVLEPFHSGYEALRLEHPGTEILPGLMLLRGPRPAASFAPPAPLVAPTAWDLARWIASSFGVLLAVGIGWSFGLLCLPWLDRIALAPAFGLATLVIAGFIVGSTGVITSGPAGRWMAVGVAGAGWLVGAARWARNRRS